jgi:HK97 gp10 family phage protein
MSKGTVRVQIDLKDVHRAVDAAIRAASPPAVTDALVAAMKVYQESAQDKAPVGATGNLRASIQMEVAGPTSVSVGTDSPYSLVQEFGATIRAKKKFIKFPGNGGVVFMRRVTIHPQPYFLPAFNSDTPSAERAFGDEFDRNFTK